MKHSGKLILSLMSGLLLCVQTQAVTSETGGNKYDNIVVRNVFGLRPPPPPVDPKSQVEVKTPPITLQGIINAFGKKQVLFKTNVPLHPGEPPKEQSFVMSEGERIGDIEVLEINEAAGTVRFRNSGVDQLKDITKDSVKPPSGPAVAPMAARPAPGGVPAPSPVHTAPPALPNSSVTTFGSPSPNVTIPGRPMRTSPAPGGPTGIASPQTSAQPDRPLTAEEQTVLIELNRRIHAKDIESGAMPPLPPTELSSPTPPARPQ